LNRFGAVDPSEGGRTQRHSAELGLQLREHDLTLDARLYAVRYDFGLFSNFTFFARDPVQGDGIEQTDRRSTLGGTLRLGTEHGLGAGRLRASFGLDSRVDSASVGLFQQQARRRLGTVNAAHIQEASAAAFAESRFEPAAWLSLLAALRLERLQAEVEPRGGNQVAGSPHAQLALPKLGVELQPARWLSLFGNYGRGFHSNDARAAIDQNTSLMVPALGYEAGLRARPRPELSLYATAFLLDLKSELVWSGDEGTTEVAPPSRRAGVELGARLRASGWLFADIDATFAHARLRHVSDGDRVPLAPSATFTAGIGAQPRFGPWQPFGAYRVRAIAARPADETGSLTAPGYVIQDLSAGMRYRDIELGVDVFNLFDVAWRPVNFATTSRLAYEPSPVTGLSFVPGWPRTVLAHAALYWR
jgi:outer membrane receptor protein involved in Fe transport